MIVDADQRHVANTLSSNKEEPGFLRCTYNLLPADLCFHGYVCHGCGMPREQSGCPRAQAAVT